MPAGPPLRPGPDHPLSQPLKRRPVNTLTMADAVPTERLPEREALLEQLEVGGYLTDPRLEGAMLEVPRHLFLPEDLRSEAYDDKPLPVGFGQTVSAPHMVAMMTSALHLEEGDRVLEIGTGVGYHAAVVKGVVGSDGEVVSIEYLPELAELSAKNLEDAGYDVRVIQGDGFEGAADHAPFDAIYVTCAIPRIPPALIGQLADGGHFVAPVGVTRCQLLAGHKAGEELELDDLGPCLFVNGQGRLGEPDEDGDEWDDDDDDDDAGGGMIVPEP